MFTNNQHEITKRGPVFDENGCLRESGWAKNLVLDYHNSNIAANNIRLKEWDYYLMLNARDNIGLALCYADNRYMGLVTATLYDFNNGKKYDNILPKAFPMGRMNVPLDSSTGDIIYKSPFVDFKFLHIPDGRYLKCKYSKLSLGGEFEAEIFLKQPPMDTMVIATPWKEDKTAFYYNQKINCMPASGWVKFKGKKYIFDESEDFGTLDWGRGVWTYDNTWYWSSGNMVVEGKPFGYNIGFGFGDTSAASEDMLFYDGVCHKLDRVKWELPENLMDKWHFSCTNGRFEMEFTPMYDNRTNLSLGVIKQDAHQMFGHLNGKAILDDGKVLEIKNMLMFAEKVRNKY